MSHAAGAHYNAGGHLSMQVFQTSREFTDNKVRDGLLKDVAFNRDSMNDGHHRSPFDNNTIQIGADGIEVRLVQGIDEDSFKRTLSMATRATIGLDLSGQTMDDIMAKDTRDWEEMLAGGLQTALETQVIVFAVSGVSRTCTHQLVRSRKASFHQQSQRASSYGEHPEARMPESVWRHPVARKAWLDAKAASDYAYKMAREADISYQDARYVLLEGTSNYIMCEYSVREFMNVFAYRGCSMFSWEIVYVMREMRRLLIEAYPWLAPYVKISCEASKRCTFQGWETVEGQCDLPWAKEANRTFQPKFHKIDHRKEEATTDATVASS
jgi:flavin-dependent thymidylate synthase